jgi:hypothetical protein
MVTGASGDDADAGTPAMLPAAADRERVLSAA